MNLAKAYVLKELIGIMKIKNIIPSILLWMLNVRSFYKYYVKIEMIYFYLDFNTEDFQGSRTTLTQFSIFLSKISYPTETSSIDKR